MTHAHDSRRDFLKTSAGAAAGAAIATSMVAPPVHAGGSDIIRVGLIGCGGRGTGAAEQACNAGPDVQLTAMGDMFSDRLDKSIQRLRGPLKEKFAVKDGHRFTGFDAYKHVIDSGVDVVLLATPPHFRPIHLQAAIDAGKHVFAEKPVAVDAPGVRKVLAATEAAKEKKLSIVSGLCWRYSPMMREIIDRIHKGVIGNVVTIQSSYVTGGLWHVDRQPEMSDMEWQLRNWLYFAWLSGDFNVEQHIHSLDKVAWVMRDEYPVKAWGMGGRQARTDPKYGHIFDHHSVVYEFANGTKAFSYCRQIHDCHKDVSDRVYGSNGDADLMNGRINGPYKYRFPRKERGDMFQQEHNELFESIRTGKPINNGEYMAKSTLMAIMGRMATYTGQLITWNKALNSQEDLSPPEYKFGSLPVSPVAIPGTTKFV